MSVLHGAGSQPHLRRHPSKAGLRMGALPGAHYDPFVQKSNTFHCPQDKGAEGPVPLALLTCGVAGLPLWATRCEFIRRPHHPAFARAAPQHTPVPRSFSGPQCEGPAVSLKTSSRSRFTGSRRRAPPPPPQCPLTRVCTRALTCVNLQSMSVSPQTMSPLGTKPLGPAYPRTRSRLSINICWKKIWKK